MKQDVRDFKGRLVTTLPYCSNCLPYAIGVRKRMGGSLRVRWGDQVPHFYVEIGDERHEFVYGVHGRNGRFPFWFKGYGVCVPVGSL